MLAGLKKISYVILVLAVLSAPKARAGEKLTVAAAANLSVALKELGAAFEKASHVTPVLSFGDTVGLTRQIEEGAPYDVFLSADTVHVKDLDSGGFIFPDTATVYARGQIVVVWNKRYLSGPVGIDGLSGPGVKRIAIANPAHAPYGIAAMEALKSVGIWDKIKDKLVYGENIRQTLQFVQSGDAQAGIVALSIADVPEVGYTNIDQALYRPINQAACVIKTAKDEKAAREFIGFIKGPVGRKILVKYGFGVD